MLIYYTDGQEVIVTTPEQEPETINLYFATYTGREISDYERMVVKDGMFVVSNDVKIR